MLACEESRSQEVEAPLAVDRNRDAVAEHFWVTQARLAHAVLHEAGVGTVDHCRTEQGTSVFRS